MCYSLHVHFSSWSSISLSYFCLCFISVLKESKVKLWVDQLCPILYDFMDYNPLGSSVHGILQARTLEWVAHSFLQEILPTQGLNLGLLHCGQILYHLSHREAPNLFILASPSLSCSMWGLVPWPEIKPRSPHWESKVLATGSPGKSLLSWGLIFNSLLVQLFLFSRYVWLFVTPWIAACQASLSFIIPWTLIKFYLSIELVIPSNHLILCPPLLLLPSIFLSIRTFSNF